jgi:hypothetical protein
VSSLPGIRRRARIRIALPAAALLLLALAPAAHAWIYWGHWDYGQGVGRAALDGTQANEAFVPGPPGLYAFSRGVAVDSNYIYWGTHGLNTDPSHSFTAPTVGRSPLSGVGPNYTFTAATAQSLTGLAVSATHVYWTGANQDTGDIGRTPVAGGQQYQAFDSVFGQPNPVPCGVAVDDKYVYFANRETSSIGRAELAGYGTASQVIEGQWIQLSASQALTVKPCGVAVDDKYVYWGIYQTSTNGVITPGTTIGRALKADGSGATNSFAGGGRGVTGLAIDGTTIYASNWNDGIKGHGSIGRANIVTGAGDPDFITGLDAPFGVAVDAGGPAPPPPVPNPPPVPIPPSPPPVVCNSCGSGGPPASTVAPDFSRVWGGHTVFAPASWSTPIFAVVKPGPAADALPASAVARGMVFNYILDKAGMVRIVIARAVNGRRVRGKCQLTSRRKRNPSCTRLIGVVTLTRVSHAGHNQVPFSGRIGGQALKPGRYTAIFVGAAQSGNAMSPAKTLNFQIVKP